ncbi:MAG: GTP pyrophosphokinase [Gammaproteobacteria bacterium]|nr:GTP pyrophosphokinase [Gammaproteobacteria bacterium]
MSSVDKAIEIAVHAHSGQLDKAGKPYILHPLRIMLKFQNELEQITAVLHDVIEDSELSIKDLESHGFHASVLRAIDCLTKRYNEEYIDFIVRVSADDLATKIKIADLKDNMELTRLPSVEDEDLLRVQKYKKALNILESTD